MLGKIILVLGILGTLLGGLIFVVSLLLPALTGNKVNFGEALPGILGGFVFLFFSLLVAVVGLILVIRNRKTKK